MWQDQVQTPLAEQLLHGFVAPPQHTEFATLKRVVFRQYPQSEVNEPILLHEGRFRVRWGDRCVEGSGSARLRWLPSPGIEFDIDIAEPFFGRDFDSLTTELPGFRTENVLAHSLTAGLASNIRAFASTMESDCQEDLLSVGFQVVNFTNFITPGLSATPGDPTAIAVNGTGRLSGGANPTGSATTQVQSFTCAAAEFRHDGWSIGLVALPESRNRQERLQATGGYSFTHVGQLTKIDGSTFTVQSAKEILESLRVFLSFVHGAACSLPIRWGHGSTGEIVWRQFQSPIVDSWRQRLSWFDKNHGELLGELFGPFCRVHDDERLRESLVLALHWYRHCNTNSSGTQGSFILGMTALDLLSALIVVGRCRSMSARKHDRLGAAKKLHALLNALDVPVDIPTRYAALTAFAEKNGMSNSFEALTKLRHGLVHANEKHRRDVLDSVGREAVFGAWHLSLWYQELALLHLLRHGGSYRNRTTAKFVGQVEPVPWSDSPRSGVERRAP